MTKIYDPRMHTAEHILNQVVDSRHGCGRCFSAHIEARKSKCDYHFHRELDPEDCAALERQVNAVIARDLPVTEEWVPRAAAAARFNLERLPDSAGDPLRIVRVGDFDACPCAGPHVPRTGAIGAFHMTTASFADGVLRIRFKLEAPKGPP